MVEYIFRNDDRIFGIKSEDRFSHIYVIGKTGTGKSTLIESMANPAAAVDYFTSLNVPVPHIAVWHAR